MQLGYAGRPEMCLNRKAKSPCNSAASDSCILHRGIPNAPLCWGCTVRRAYEARLFPTTVTVSIPGALVCIVVTSVAGFGCATASELARYPPTLPMTANVSRPALSFFKVSVITLS